MQKADAADVAALVEQHYAEVFGYLHRLVGDRSLATTLARATFLRSLRASGEPAEIGGPRAGIYRTATSLALDALKDPPAAATGDPGGPTAPITWGERSPVERGLTAVPLAERALLLLIGRYGFTVTDAAEVLGTSVAVVRAELTHARRASRASYAPNDALTGHAAGLSSTSATPDASASFDEAGANMDRLEPDTSPISRPRYAGLETSPQTDSQVEDRRAETLLPIYGQITPAERAIVDEHVAGCALCAAELAIYGRMDRDLEGLPDPLTAPGATRDLAAEIRMGARSGDPGYAKRHPIPPWLTLALAFVLVLSLVLTVGLWGQRAGALRSIAPDRPSLALPIGLSGTPPPSTLLPSPTPERAGGVATGAGAPSSAAVAWLSGHALPILSTEPGNSVADLAELRDMIGAARVVVVDDDAGFGAHETQALRQRLLELLVEEMGVRTLVLPVDWAAGDELDRYIQGGPGDPLQMLNDVRQSRGVAGGVWQTQEMLYTLQWLRLRNQGAKSDRVAIRAIMPIERSRRVPVEITQSYIWRVDRSMTFMSTDWGRQLSSYIEAHRSAFEAATGPVEFDRALRAAHAVEQFQAINVVSTPDERAQMVTQFLEENLSALIADADAAGKTVVWTQGLSALQDPTLQNLLASTRRQHSPAVVTLGFAFGRGSLYLSGRAAREPTALPQAGESVQPPVRFAVYSLPAAPPGTFEDYLGQAGVSHFFANLRGAPGPWDKPVWLREPPLVRSLTAVYSECRPDDYFRRADPRGTYDILVYFDRVSPVTLLYKPDQVPAAPCP